MDRGLFNIVVGRHIDIGTIQLNLPGKACALVGGGWVVGGLVVGDQARGKQGSDLMMHRQQASALHPSSSSSGFELLELGPNIGSAPLQTMTWMCTSACRHRKKLKTTSFWR